jgi:hypothetical protein
MLARFPRSFFLYSQQATAKWPILPFRGRWDLIEIHWDIIVIHWDLIVIHWDLIVIHWDLIVIHWDLIVIRMIRMTE